MQLPELQGLCVDRFSGTADPERRCELEDQVSGGSSARATRIAVYENNFAEIIANTLSRVFPTIEQLVGDLCFRSLARCYSQQHVSLSGDLQSYGRAFPGMLDEIYSATEHAFLGDIARLEFALDECLIREYLPGISGEHLLAALSEDDADVMLIPNPSLHLIESRFPILTIWRAHRDNDLENLSLDQEAQSVVVVRAGNDAQMTAVSRLGAQLIRSLSEIRRIDDILPQPGEADSDQLAQALRDIVASAAVTGVWPE